MDDLRISRRRLVGAGAVGTLGILLGPGAALAEEDERDKVDVLRWDMVQTLNGVVVPGGSDVSRDPKSGDTLTLTGSGQARPRRRTATGGGTFINKHASGIESAKLGHGIYYVIGFNSFVNGGGSLAGSGLIDEIGDLERTTGGVLSLNVHVVAVTGQQADGVLEIHCALPGGQTDTQGFRLALRVFQFEPDPTPAGFYTTLFHALER